MVYIGIVSVRCLLAEIMYVHYVFMFRSLTHFAMSPDLSIEL